VVIPRAFTTGFGIAAAAHAHIPADPNSAALLGHQAAQWSACIETWEFLGAVDEEWLRADIKAVRKGSRIRRTRCGLNI
jgi:hypothetical protein